MEKGNKIPENWKAIEDAEKLCRERTGDPEAGFNAGVFWLGSKDGRHLMIPIKYRSKRGKNGKEVFTKSYKELNIYANFCPFTGKPLYENSEEIIKG
ncbi:hypothetical protein [Leeuwenhoekiella marinoflava]|uniref:Uncharacterized protein n=2 Tax=Leeuwenhoekiella marinoflava TaxID=988 RepID=A0A4Q0PNK1_9FLAO|nr:hypothetical protein [Leeuwenhoekiella marinoflava]RXG32021.1 hypothetical protein DSL99_1326 [Leeuwenhoekiella marinoflava]SHE95267.1 hypothetical protein SAMN02745246_01382 [Leeuwenhoekiella marinoflava DSM 3653]